MVASSIQGDSGNDGSQYQMWAIEIAKGHSWFFFIPQKNSLKFSSLLWSTQQAHFPAATVCLDVLCESMWALRVCWDPVLQSSTRDRGVLLFSDLVAQSSVTQLWARVARRPEDPAAGCRVMWWSTRQLALWLTGSGCSHGKKPKPNQNKTKQKEKFWFTNSFTVLQLAFIMENAKQKEKHAAGTLALQPLWKQPFSIFFCCF